MHAHLMGHSLPVPRGAGDGTYSNDATLQAYLTGDNTGILGISVAVSCFL